MNCDYCDKDSTFKCSVCGKLICAEHTRLRTVCTACSKRTPLRYSIAEVKSDKEKMIIRELAQRFWGEDEQLTFNRKFSVTNLPTYAARVDGSVAGFVSFAETDDYVIIVALGILPKYQNAGVSRSLIERVEAEAKRSRKKEILVSTSNDDLPALAFYQGLGFQIYEMKPNVIAEKHGQILKGIGGLPIRDELRLRKTLY